MFSRSEVSRWFWLRLLMTFSCHLRIGYGVMIINLTRKNLIKIKKVYERLANVHRREDTFYELYNCKFC